MQISAPLEATHSIAASSPRSPCLRQCTSRTYVRGQTESRGSAPVASSAVASAAVTATTAVTATDVSEAAHVQQAAEVEAEAVQAEALVGVPERDVVGPRRIAECPCLAARHVEHAGCAQAAQLLQVWVLLAQQQHRAARLVGEGRCALWIRADPIGEVLASEAQPAAE